MKLESYIAGLKAGNKRILSKAISLAESHLEEHYELALQIVEHFPRAVSSRRIGITGTPGAGKSTFIDAFGALLVQESPQMKIAVLSIDPSSSLSGGSILGDKTRMTQLSKLDTVYIRPSASGHNLGGLARSTRLAILLCEAAGYDTLFIESVGVGQGETELAQLCDLFLLLLNPGGGDELQGIKRGIVEMADLLVVNKADHDRVALAKQTARDYRNAQMLMPETATGWKPRVLLCSALGGSGLEEVKQAVDDYFIYLSDQKDILRTNQHAYWVFKVMQDLVIQRLRAQDESIEQALASGVLPERIALQLSKDFIN